MFHFFRKMRWRLARDNQFLKYSRYAVGEILLIVIGLIIALQLQNWNENRQQKEKFKTVLEQIYNSVQEDVEFFDNRRNLLEFQSALIDTLLEEPERLDRENMPGLLYWIAQNMGDLSSETNFHLANLEYNPENPKQNEIARLVATYADKNQMYKQMMTTNLDQTDQSLWKLLQENAITNPGNISSEVLDRYLHTEQVYFTEAELMARQGDNQWRT